MKQELNITVTEVRFFEINIYVNKFVVTTLEEQGAQIFFDLTQTVFALAKII